MTTTERGWPMFCLNMSNPEPPMHHRILSLITAALAAILVALMLGHFH